MKTASLLRKQAIRLVTVLTIVLLASTLRADQVIIQSFNPDGTPNVSPDYKQIGVWSVSSASVPGLSAPKSAYTVTSNPIPSLILTPHLAVAGGIYTISVAHVALLGCTNLLVGLSSPDGTIGGIHTDGFQPTHGSNAWYQVGVITNNPGVTDPAITFTYLSGNLNIDSRWYSDGFMFDCLTCGNCLQTPQLATVGGPLAAGQTFVNVPNVTNTATKVTVYSDDGTTQTAIGSLTVSGVTNAVVPVTALTKGRYISATQTVAGQEGCLIPLGTGAIVGGGANAPLGLGFCLNMQQDASLTGPIGAPSSSGSSDLYFLGADGRKGGFGTAPADPTVIIPSTCWQTVYIDPTTANYFHWTVISSNPDTNHFAALDAIAIAIEDTDTGPYEIYIDNFMNGDTVIQDWESATVGQTVGFSQPSFSSTTSGFLLAQAPASISPNISVVTTNHADSGTKSLHVNWQFINTLSVNWVRLNALNHPEIDLSKPISFRVLVLPVGVTTGDMNVSTIADQTQNAGGSATFSVTATGVGPFTYQWSFNDTNAITGATNSSYTASNLAANNAGRYTVAVTDGNGCTSYSSANLTVNTVITPVTITITYSGGNVILNWPGSHTLQSAPTATGPFTDVSPAVFTGPYVTGPSGNAKFFRLGN